MTSSIGAGQPGYGGRVLGNSQTTDTTVDSVDTISTTDVATADATSTANSMGTYPTGGADSVNSTQSVVQQKQTLAKQIVDLKISTLEANIADMEALMELEDKGLDLIKSAEGETTVQKKKCGKDKKITNGNDKATTDKASADIKAKRNEWKAKVTEMKAKLETLKAGYADKVMDFATKNVNTLKVEHQKHEDTAVNTAQRNDERREARAQAIVDTYGELGENVLNDEKKAEFNTLLDEIKGVRDGAATEAEEGESSIQGNLLNAQLDMQMDQALFDQMVANGFISGDYSQIDFASFGTTQAAFENQYSSEISQLQGAGLDTSEQNIQYLRSGGSVALLLTQKNDTETDNIDAVTHYQAYKS